MPALHWGSSVLGGVAALWGWQQLPGLLVPWKTGVMQPPQSLPGSLGGGERNKPRCRWALPIAHPSGSGESGSGPVADDEDVPFAPPCVASLNARRGVECRELGQS